MGFLEDLFRCAGSLRRNTYRREGASTAFAPIKSEVLSQVDFALHRAVTLDQDLKVFLVQILEGPLPSEEKLMVITSSIIGAAKKRIHQMFEEEANDVP